MRHIVKFGLTKSGKRINLPTAVRYGLCSLGEIGIFDPISIQGASRIAFPIKHCCKPTLSSPLFRANLSTLQLEVGQGGRILEKMPQN